MGVRKEYNSLKQKIGTYGIQTPHQPEVLPILTFPSCHLDSSVLYVQSEHFMNCWQDTQYSTNISIPCFEKTFCETEELELFAVFFKYNYCR